MCKNAFEICKMFMDGQREVERHRDRNKAKKIFVN